MKLALNDVRDAASDLSAAENTRKQVGLMSLRFPDLDMEGAYEIQSAFVGIKRAAGLKSIGWKIGLTSKTMQRALGIATPDSGVLLEDMLFETGAVISTDKFIRPRVEAEIAFLMKSPLCGEDVTSADVFSATEFAAPALEILDTRIVRKDPGSGKPRTVLDTIADNAANAGVVLGSDRHHPDSFDLRWVGAIVSRNGDIEETGLGAAVLGDPFESVAWLCRRLSRYGDCISAGELVLSGSFIRPIECPPGTAIEADFGAFGRVDVKFAGLD